MYFFSSTHQEIDGKSLLLMQRSDVLTGLSIRLGPALKIYERHVKVLQRTHFLECEDLWSHKTDHSALSRKCMQCPLPHRLYHPLHVHFMLGASGSEHCGGFNFHCENDQKLKDKSSYLSSWPFSSQMVFTLPHMADHFCRKGNRRPRLECS